MSISTFEPDWSREVPQKFWDPSRKLLKSIRDYQSSTGFRRKFANLRHHFWSVVTGADIPLNVKIGGGLMLPHPNGIVIHPRAEIGPNCIIFQHVTLGVNGEVGKAPKIGAGVTISPGACVLGLVHIGHQAVIGANAVVLKDVLEEQVVVGVPARLIKKRKI